MSGSRTIRVLKRGGGGEEFDDRKLAAALWRAMGGAPPERERAEYLADAVRFYLDRRGARCVSSAAIFEMCQKLLHHARHVPAAKCMQDHARRRAELRRSLRVRHDYGRLTFWDKSWLAAVAQRCWNLSPGTARILAGMLESELLAEVAHHAAQPDRGDLLHRDIPRIIELPRQEILDRLNALTAAFGLADAVPVGR